VAFLDGQEVGWSGTLILHYCLFTVLTPRAVTLFVLTACHKNRLEGEIIASNPDCAERLVCILQVRPVLIPHAGF
jgi:hypothetical protein